MWNSISGGYGLSLYGEEMTRFFIDIEDAVDLIETALNYTGYNVIPILKSMKISDLFGNF